jgi:phosphoglycolate phosphatase
MPTDNRTAHKGILLFDLDGTLVDSAPDLAEALNRVLADAGAEPLDLSAVTGMVGDGVRKLVERGLAARAPTLDLPALDLDAAVARFLDIYEGALAVASRPYPGVVETLDALAAEGWRMAVCTNKPEAASRVLLGALGLDRHLEAIAGGDSYPVRKPDPRHLTLTLEQLGANGAPAVLVGDSRNDLLAPRQRRCRWSGRPTATAAKRRPPWPIPPASPISPICRHCCVTLYFPQHKGRLKISPVDLR